MGQEVSFFLSFCGGSYCDYLPFNLASLFASFSAFLAFSAALASFSALTFSLSAIAELIFPAVSPPRLSIPPLPPPPSALAFFAFLARAALALQTLPPPIVLGFSLADNKVQKL
eukprot:TRINITY_DN201_c4_g1_i1.p1 TRINITY_DN201_c4_g1~~TRINITY_DN201_c4_g1_i1.p1  ORF type:complete len:114 (-),score=10.49 TRINITY_DN201_c4_g1_i1:3-344(-)